jgi:SsrA-binding protein
MAKKKPAGPKKIVNRKARHDYDVASDLVAGIALNGRETKALRMGHGHLRGAYVTVKDNELWLINATITGFGGVKLDEAEQTQNRKLLLKRREIDKLLEAKQQGLAIVPLELLTGGRYIKVRIAVGRGRKHYDKRQTIKERDQTRANQQELKSYR